MLVKLRTEGNSGMGTLLLRQQLQLTSRDILYKGINMGSKSGDFQWPTQNREERRGVVIVAALVPRNETLRAYSRPKDSTGSIRVWCASAPRPVTGS